MDKKTIDQENRLNEVFSPSSPIQKQQFFLGRLDELSRVVDAINERGQHVVVYGDRGVGKTSFANVVATKINNLFSVSVTCSSLESFTSLWKKALSKVSFKRSRKGLGYLPAEIEEPLQLDLFEMDDYIASPNYIQSVLENLDYHLLFIFDEYDVVEDDEVHKAMAETIKSLSDNCANVSIMIVGVGRNIEDLLQYHKSIDRCLAQVRIQRMEDSDIRGILDRAEAYLGIVYRSAVKDSIVSISSGFPHFTHLLGKLSVKSAQSRSAPIVGEEHLTDALKLGLERADETTRLAYQRATLSSHKTSTLKNILTTCALLELDEHSSFRGADVKKLYRVITGSLVCPSNITYYLNDLCLDSRGGVLERIEDGRRVRYKFRNPFVRAYCKMKNH